MSIFRKRGYPSQSNDSLRHIWDEISFIEKATVSCPGAYQNKSLEERIQSLESRHSESFGLSHDEINRHVNEIEIRLWSLIQHFGLKEGFEPKEKT